MVKHILYSILIFLMPVSALANDEMQGLFDTANKLYAKNQYRESIITYQKIIDAGYSSSDIYYNLGNAFYKTGNVPLALVYYEKARKIKPNDNDLRVNIRLANSKTVDKIEEIPEFFLFNIWRDFLLLFSGNTLAIMSVLFFLSASASLIRYLFAKSVGLKKITFYAGIVFLLLGVISIWITYRQAEYLRSHTHAIILNNSVQVKKDPDNLSKRLFVIHSGTKIEMLERNNRWIKIKLANGNEGWIINNGIKEI